MHGCFKKIYKLKLENNTQVFLANPCFLKKMVYDVLCDTLTHPQKTWICQKKIIFSSLTQDGMTELGGGKECVSGRINANLQSKIRDANTCN